MLSENFSSRYTRHAVLFGALEAELLSSDKIRPFFRSLSLIAYFIKALLEVDIDKIPRHFIIRACNGVARSLARFS